MLDRALLAKFLSRNSQLIAQSRIFRFLVFHFLVDKHVCDVAHIGHAAQN